MQDLPIFVWISTGLQNLNVKYTRKVNTKADETVFSQEAVRIQGSGEPYKNVFIKNPVYSPEASALLDQLVE